MPRPHRIRTAGLTLHVVQRGTDRNRTFFRNGDYLSYLNALIRSCERYGTTVHAYALMTNHVHLLMTPTAEGGISRTMQYLTSAYGRYINRENGRTGGLWEGRFRSSAIDSDHYCIACYRYIELNPVRAGITAHPSGYRWSSYLENVGERTPSIVKPHPSFEALAASKAKRIEAYRKIVSEELPEKVVEAIRHSTNSGIPFGSDRFRQSMTR